jgi:excisionase family DNA binding protein
MNKDFLSVLELAAELNVHPNTIYKAVKEGRINAFKVTGGKKSSLRIPRTEITRLATDDFRRMQC